MECDAHGEVWVVEGVGGSALYLGVSSIHQSQDALRSLRYKAVLYIIDLDLLTVKLDLTRFLSKV